MEAHRDKWVRTNIIPMIKISSALLNFDRLVQSLSNCKMDQSWRVEHYGLISLPLLSSISCRPAWGLSLLIECINIGCRDDVVEVVFGQKMRIIFQIALFRISLMDKWSFWKGIGFMHPGHGGRWTVQFELVILTSLAPAWSSGRKSKVFLEVWTTSGDWKFYA